MNHRVKTASIWKPRMIGLLCFTSLLSIVTALLDFMIPVAISIFLNWYKAGMLYSFWAFLGVLLPLCLFSYLAKMLLNHLFWVYAVRFKTAQHEKLYERMLQADYHYLTKQEPTYLSERIAICANTLYDVYIEGVSKGVIAIATVLTAFLLVLRENFMVAFFLAALLVVQILGYKRLNQALQNRSMELQKRTASCFKNLLSITGQIDYMKQEGKPEGILSMLRPFIRSIHEENAGVNQFAQNISTTLSAGIRLLQNLVYFYTAILLAQGKMDTAAFILVSMVSSLYMSGLGSLVSWNLGLRDLKGVKEFIQELEAHREPEGTLPLERVENICFQIEKLGYGSMILIEQGRLEARRGDSILLSGNSGTGKTTLMKALLKFFPASTIFINGTDIQELRTTDIRKRIQFLSQNIPIITGTIEENLRMGKQVSKERWEELKKKPFLQKFCALPEGLETVILENGSNLSGGDKQKLALARLYLEQPDVIILDESTNSMEESASYELLQEVKQEFSDSIIFLISHDSRLQSLCQKAVKLENRRIIPLASGVLDSEKKWISD